MLVICIAALRCSKSNMGRWRGCTTSSTRRQVYLTELAFANPLQQRGKARYMSVDRLVTWGNRLLKWLEKPRPIGRELTASRIAEKIGWLRDYREPLQQWTQAMQVIDCRSYPLAPAAEPAGLRPTNT
jgi:hypothetical protein